MSVVMDRTDARPPLVPPWGADLDGGLVQQRLTIAEEIGEEADRLRVEMPDWSVLTKRVVVVTVAIGYYRGRKRLQAEDLGLQALLSRDPEFAQYLRQAVLLGSKRLLPSGLMGKVELVESRTRYALEKVSLKTGFGHLVGRDLYPDLKTQLQQNRDEFFRLRDEVYANYEDVFGEMLDVYRKLGRGALNAFQRDGGTIDEPADVWIESYAQRVMSHLPPAETLAASYTFEWWPAFLATSSDVVEDLALAELRRREAELNDARLRLEAQNIRYQEDFNYQRMQAELEEIRARARREEELAREVQAHAEQQHAQWIEGTFKDISCQLREVVYEDMVNVLSSMQAHGHLVRNSSKEIKGTIERLRRLNYLDDEDIVAMRRQLEAVVDSNPKKRSAEAIAGVLKQIATLTRADLLAAGRSPRSGAELAIPEEIEPERRAAARRAVVGPPPVLEVPSLGRRRGPVAATALPL